MMNSPELTVALRAAAETYSNVHRGTGHFARATTRLYEQAKRIVVDHLGLRPGDHAVVVCTPRRAEALASNLGSVCRVVSSEEHGLPFGVRALAIPKRGVPKAMPFQTGGGTARLVGGDWVVWAKPSERLEAGTPPILPAIGLAKALLLADRAGKAGVPAEARAPGPLAEDILCPDALEAKRGQALLTALRETLVGREQLVPTRSGSRRYVNLANAASTPTFDPVWEASMKAMVAPAEVRSDLPRKVRAIAHAFLGTSESTHQVVFASNSTEAINLVAESLQRERRPETQTVVLNTVLEHNSNELVWRTTPGLSSVRIGVSPEGFLDLAELERLLAAYNKNGEHAGRRVELVAVSGASNVLGVVNDLGSIADIAHRYGARLLVDGAQLVPHRKVDLAALKADYLVFSAHKMYAPFGTGVLVARRGLLSFSASEMERIDGSGEENSVGIAALGKAMLLLQRIGLDVVQEHEQRLTRRLVSGVARVPGVVLYGIGDPDAPAFAHKTGVVALELKDMLPHRAAAALAECGGIGVRPGCHCAHLLVKRMMQLSRPLEQFQRLIVSMVPGLELPGVLRVSLGIENTEEDVDHFVEVLRQLARRSESPKTHRATERAMNEFADDLARRVFGSC